jgi:Holliday junction resolvase RusA-like endonuclease
MGNKILRLTSPVPVSVNNYLKPRAFIMNVKGRMVAQTTMYETKEARDYKKHFVTYVKQEIQKQNWSYEEGKFVVVKVVIYFEKTNRDANNIWKLLLDALTEANVYKDDSIVMERVERIYYDVEHPRVELEIYHSDHVGIFDSQEDYETFNARCMTCSRYKNNCSIRVKCLESRIQEDVELWQCKKYKEIKVKK